MFAYAMLAQGGTLATIRQSLPSDPASLFVLALCVIAAAVIFIGGRDKGKGAGKGGGAS